MAGTSYKGSQIKDVDQFLKGDGLDSEREKVSLFERFHVHELVLVFFRQSADVASQGVGVATYIHDCPRSNLLQGNKTLIHAFARRIEHDHVEGLSLL